jgi:hypothetical protein
VCNGASFLEASATWNTQLLLLFRRRRANAEPSASHTSVGIPDAYCNAEAFRSWAANAVTRKPCAAFRDHIYAQYGCACSVDRREEWAGLSDPEVSVVRTIRVAVLCYFYFYVIFIFMLFLFLFIFIYHLF